MTVKTFSHLRSDVSLAYADVGLDQIAPSDLRGSLTDIIDSTQARIDSADEMLANSNVVADALADKVEFINGKLSPISIVHSSAMPPSEGVVGLGVQAEFNEIPEPPQGIVTAYAARTVVAPKVDWTNGWTSGMSVGVVASGAKRINKVVANYTSLEMAHAGSSAILGYEVSLGLINPTGSFDVYSAYFSPNLEFVPNRHRVGRMASFTCQDTGQVIQSYGPYIDSKFRELAPAPHPGYTPGRYYTNPFDSITNFANIANNAICMSINIAARVDIAKFTVMFGTGANSTPDALYRMAVYSSVQGKVSEQVYITPTFKRTGTEISKTFDVTSLQLDSGQYWMMLVCNGVGTQLQVHRFAISTDIPWKYGLLNVTDGATSAEWLRYLPIPDINNFPTNPQAEPAFFGAAGSPEPHILFTVRNIPLPSYAGNGRPLS